MRTMVPAMFLAVALLAGAPAGQAAAEGGISAVKQRVESSMLVRGEVGIDPDGSVFAIQLEKENELPTGVVSMVRDAAMKWRFEPIIREGVAVRARAPITLRVIARKLENDSYEISMRGINFDRLDGNTREGVTSVENGMTPPRYPEVAFRNNIAGTVYTVLKVGRDGKVEEAFAEQVNLTFLSREREQARARDLLAKASLDAARKWTFRIPTEGPAAAHPYWNIRVPVSFAIGDRVPKSDLGHWVSYVAGPRERAPWNTDEDLPGFSPDALVDGSVNMADNKGPRLLTPLQGG
jgi:hypothetical protein